MSLLGRPLHTCHALKGLLISRCFSVAPNVHKLAAIKELRESSGAPISDVKAALDEAKYDLGEPRAILIFIIMFIAK